MPSAPRPGVTLPGNQPLDIFHGRTSAGNKPGLSDFASSEAQTETDEELIEILTKGKNKLPSHKNTLEEAQIMRFVVHIRELGHKK